MRNVKDIPNIKRADYLKVKGWMFRVCRSKEHHSKLFSDSVYGSSNAALKAAMAYKENYKKTNLIEKLHHHLKNKKSETGTVGVSLTKRVINNSISHVGWSANLIVNGKQKHFYYSIKKWGYSGAYLLARSDRLNFMKETVLPDKVPKPPIWLLPFLNQQKIHYESV